MKLGLEKIGEKLLRDRMFWSGESAEVQRAEELGQVSLRVLRLQERPLELELVHP